MHRFTESYTEPMMGETLEEYDRRMAENARKRLERQYRQRRAVGLRRAGLTYREIAAACGYNSPDAARKAVEALLKQQRSRGTEAAEALLTLELDRLDRLNAAVWPRAMLGRKDAVLNALRVHDRRVKLDPDLAPLVQTATSAEEEVRADRDAATLLVDILLSLADRLDYTPAQRVQAPTALRDELAARGLIDPPSPTAHQVIPGEIGA